MSQREKQIERFDAWCEDHGMNFHHGDEGVIPALNAYIKMELEPNYASSSVKTYSGYIINGYGFSAKRIDRPKVSVADVQRGRGDTADRAKQQMADPKYRDFIEAAKHIGIRKDELCHLQGRDLVEYKGHLCVHVIKGKGGKEQYQRILPSHEQAVRDLFANKDRKEHLFAKDTKDNVINTHQYRREVAQEAYDYYKGIVSDSEASKGLYKALLAYWKDMHPKSDYGSHKAYKDAYNRYREDIFSRGGGEYRLRGANKERAKELGLPVVYNRLALAAVSAFHLSHWRLDVTVQNYMM